MIIRNAQSMTKHVTGTSAISPIFFIQENNNTTEAMSVSDWLFATKRRAQVRYLNKFVFAYLVIVLSTGVIAASCWSASSNTG